MSRLCRRSRQCVCVCVCACACKWPFLSFTRFLVVWGGGEFVHVRFSAFNVVSVRKWSYFWNLPIPAYQRSLQGGDGKESARVTKSPYSGMFRTFSLRQPKITKLLACVCFLCMQTRCLAEPGAHRFALRLTLSQFPSLRTLLWWKCLCQLPSPWHRFCAEGFGMSQGDIHLSVFGALDYVWAYCQKSQRTLCRRHWPRKGCPSRQWSDLPPPRRPWKIVPSLSLRGFCCYIALAVS